MTKKHFILFAETIKNKSRLEKGWDADACEQTQAAALDAVDVIVQVAKASNPRFDETRFSLACGVPA